MNSRTWDHHKARRQEVAFARLVRTQQYTLHIGMSQPRQGRDQLAARRSSRHRLSAQQNAQTQAMIAACTSFLPLHRARCNLKESSCSPTNSTNTIRGHRNSTRDRRKKSAHRRRKGTHACAWPNRRRARAIGRACSLLARTAMRVGHAVRTGAYDEMRRAARDLSSDICLHPIQKQAPRGRGGA